MDRCTTKSLIYTRFQKVRHQIEDCERRRRETLKQATSLEQQLKELKQQANPKAELDFIETLEKQILEKKKDVDKVVAKTRALKDEYDKLEPQI